MKNSIEQLKEQFIQACRILVNEKLATAFFSLSCRFNKDQYLINSGRSPALMNKEDIITASLQDPSASGKAHPAIYRAREDVNAIVHAHPPYAIALSTVKEAFAPIHSYGAIFHGKIQVYGDYGQVKTQERAQEIVDVLGKGRAILQKGHGTLVVGKDLVEAVLATIFLEEAARIHFLARGMGTPQTIPLEISQKVGAQAFKEKSNQRAWEYYLSRIKRL